MSSSRKTPICEAEFTKMEENEVKKEHTDMNPEKIAKQNQGMSKYFLFEDNELKLIEDYDDSHVYNEDTYGPTYVDPDCYYEEANAIKEVQNIKNILTRKKTLKLRFKALEMCDKERR
nr:hypothetical protein [Tanacetum cinerariifolium]